MKAIQLFILTLIALFYFSACSAKEVQVQRVLVPCPTLQTFAEQNGSVDSVRLDISEVNTTIIDSKSVKDGQYNDMWMVAKKQVKNLVFHVLDVKERLFDSLHLNDLYKQQIQEYNENNSKKGNAWQSKKE